MNIRRFDKDEFSTMKNQWQELLLRSNADHLFLSWDWMHAWWRTWAQGEFKLLLLGVYDGDRLMGIAPLYIKKAKVKFSLNSRRIEFIGTSSTTRAGFRTEYLEFIADNHCEDEVVRTVFDWIEAEISFDEMQLNDLITGSTTHRYALRFAEHGAYIRIQQSSQTYGIDTAGLFEDYIKNLGKNSRLKVFNRRKVLEDLGTVSIETANHRHSDELFDHLSEFHLHRWGHHIQYDHHKYFVRLLCEDSDIKISGVMVKLDGKLLACTYDIDCGSTCYNFQLGFSDDVDKKISMGSLAIGYAAERCFSDPRLKYYDLMAGEGKNSNYKDRIALAGKQFESLQIITNPILKLLYRAKDFLQGIRTQAPD